MSEPKNSRLAPYILIGLTCLSGVVLMGLHNPRFGWPLLGITLIITLAWPHPIRRHLPLTRKGQAKQLRSG